MIDSSDHESLIQAQNDESLRILARALTLAQGKFSLILANCQYRHVRDRIVDQLQHQCPFDIQCFTLPNSAKTLYSSMVPFVEQNSPQALMVFGLEQVTDLETILKATNQAREGFGQSFSFPIVLWVNRQVKTAFIRSAPDFESWSTTVAFPSLSLDSHSILVQESDRIFNTLLDVGSGLFLDNRTLGIQSGSPLLVELETARSTLQERGSELDALLAGSLEFICGRAAVADEVRSRQHYECSIELLKTSNVDGTLERLGCVQHHLGVWWRTYSVDHRVEHDQACEQARDCFREAIATFKAAQRLDLVARFTEKLGEVLQRLEDWDGLKQLVQERLELHPTYPDLFREARTYGFRAELALAKAAMSPITKPLQGGGATNLEYTVTGNLIKAKEWATQALQLLEDACETETTPVAFDREVFLDWHNSFLRGWYRFALGRAHQALGETDEAIQSLEQAKAETNEAYDPPLCISILRELRDLYFEQGEYLEAFETRQAYRSIEQQYGYRAFVGAGRLRAKKAIANPSLAHVESIGQVSTEISASGRQQDVDRLIGRLQRSDQKLIVLHGQSGVGKSSIIQAGLIPALTPLTVDGREVAVVLQQVYTPWDKRLGDRILETLRELGEHATEQVLESSDEILEKLHQTVNRNFMAVLILDQFEEFFFVYKDPTTRKQFYQFLHACLDIPYVKVVLSLREDYLHYLLECNNRLVKLDIINNNILDKDILFYLGNFSSDDAKAVIEGLTNQSQFSLEKNLVDALVEDLAQELGEVRPIELQVVGNQLQTEDITTLEGYEDKGPKEALVGRFLEEIVTDCGPDNEQIAKLVLYLLTDENNTRPLKTRADLELELDIEPGKLDLILQLLVKSRLVFLIPASPDDRYQLVHDYLVPFVREQQSARLIAEIEKEREQRKLTEAKLNIALKQQLHDARRVTLMLASLFITVTGIALVATIASLNNYLTTLTKTSSSKQGLDRIVSALEVAKKSEYLPGILKGTHLGILAELNQSVSLNAEVSHLEGHTDQINHIEFSHNGKLIASASKDKTVRLWKLDGTLISSLPDNDGHEESVNVVRFSQDDQILASGSNDGIIKIWQTDSNLIKTIEAHEGRVNDIQVSYDGGGIISAGDDKTVKIWDINGRLIREIEQDNRVTILRLSPDNKVIALGSESSDVKFLNLASLKAEKIDRKNPIDVRFHDDGETITLLDKRGNVDIWNYKSNTFIKNVHLGSFRNSIVSLSPNTEYLATVSSYSKESLKLRRKGQSSELNEGSVIHHLGFSPDNKYLLSVAEDNIIKLREIGTVHPSLVSKKRHIIRNIISSNTKIIKEKEISVKPKNYYPKSELFNFIRERGDMRLLALSPGKSRGFIRVSPHDRVGLWQAGQENVVFIRDGDSRVSHIHLNSSSEKSLLVENDSHISLLNVNGKLLKLEDIDFSEENNKIKDIRFTFNDQYAVGIANSHNRIYFWNLKDGKLEKVSDNAHYSEVNKIIPLPDQKRIISIGDDRFIKIWSGNGTNLRSFLGHENVVKDLIVSDDGSKMASYSRKGWEIEIKLWDKNGNNLQKKTLLSPFSTNFIFSPDSQALIINESFLGIEMWDFNSGDLIPIRQSSSIVNAAIFTPDSQRIISAGDDTTIRIWDKNGNLLTVNDEHTDSIKDIALNPDGTKLVSVDLDRTLRLWSLRNDSLAQLEEIPLHAGERVSGSIRDIKVRFSPDGKQFLCWFSFDSGKDEDEDFKINYVIQIFSKNGQLLKILTANKEVREIEDFYSSFHISDDLNNVIFSDRKDDLEILDIHGNIVNSLVGHTDWINSVDVSKDGEMIVSGGDDKTIKIWSKDGQLLINDLSRILAKNYVQKVNSVSFSPDAEFIASGSSDRAVRIWSLDGKSEIIGEHGDDVVSVQFSPNGRLIASASSDNNVQLRDAKTYELRRQFGEESINVIDTLNFNNSGNILSLGSGVGELRLYPTSNLSFFLEETELSPINTIEDLALNGDRPLETIAVDDGLEIVALGLDALMEKACNRVRGYLKNSSRVDEKDRDLCDGIGDEEVE